MASAVFPAPSAGGGIKSVQRGSAGGSGTVTITAVDINKAFVNVFGTASSGTVAASATVGSTTGTFEAGGGFGTFSNGGTRTISINSTNLTGGSNNLVAAVVQGYLSNSTSLVVSGACRWEVVEFA
jgi:hypothetical protein